MASTQDFQKIKLSPDDVPGAYIVVNADMTKTS
jgi:hypothetical protein